jgi:hypothetical protein
MEILPKKIEKEIFDKIFLMKNSASEFFYKNSPLNFEGILLEKFNNEIEKLKFNFLKKEEELNNTLNFIKFNLSEKIVRKIMKKILSYGNISKNKINFMEIKKNSFANENFNKNLFDNFCLTNERNKRIGRKKYY